MYEYTDSFRSYLNEVGKYEVLTDVEEKELTYKIAIEHDKLAKDKLINCNLRLVIDVAKRLCNKYDDFMDCISAGNIGLIKAADRFDYGKGYKFSTYAEYWIAQSIYRHMAQNSLIRYPEHVILRLNKINKMKNDLSLKLEREPTLDEIKANLENKNDLMYLDYSLNNVVSLDYMVGDDNKTALVDLISYNDINFEKEFDNKYLENLINEILSPRESEIFHLRLENMTLQDIGNRYNVTKDVIRNIIDGSIKKIKTSSSFKKYYCV